MWIVPQFKNLYAKGKRNVKHTHTHTHTIYSFVQKRQWKDKPETKKTGYLKSWKTGEGKGGEKRMGPG